MTLFVAGVLIALVISALCSVMEATLLSLTPAQVASLSQKRPRIGRIWQGFKNDVERPIAIILLLNTTAHTVGASIAGAQFGKEFGEEYLWLFAAIFTFVMLQFTEILAKSLGVRFNQGLALVIARPLQISEKALSPLLWFIHLINKPFEGKKPAHGEKPPATIEEITALAGLARLSSQISSHQERIIATAPQLSDIQVRDLQVPLKDIAWIDADQSLEEGIQNARRHPHTRFPVRRGGETGEIVGYVNMKEMFLISTDPTPNHDDTLPIRDIFRVSEDAKASEVLATFVRKRVQIAIVEDSQQRCVGLITLEDVVEELLGDIRDEFDGLPGHFHAVGKNRWSVGGGLSSREFSEQIGVSLENAGDRSLAVWFEEKLDGPLQVGSQLTAAGLQFTVRRLRRGSLYECDVRRLASDGEGSD